MANNRIDYDPLRGGMIGSMQGGGMGNYAASTHITATEISMGSESITAQDVAKFKKLLGFMEFAMSASEEMRNLMVAYEAKQRILKCDR